MKNNQYKYKKCVKVYLSIYLSIYPYIYLSIKEKISFLNPKYILFDCIYYI